MSDTEQLSCRVNARSSPCRGCGRMAVVTLEWYGNIVISHSSLALLNHNRPPEEQVIGLEMFTLCLYCLHREVWKPRWDAEKGLPTWECVETRDRSDNLPERESSP